MSNTLRLLRASGALLIALLLCGSLLSVSPATAAPRVVAQDATGDAHPNLDIQRVLVSVGPRAVVVKVKVRRLGLPDSRRLTSEIGVHFDTGGPRRPNHLVRIDGMHWSAGSTRNWNALRPNGVDPWGDWRSCFPARWRRPLIRMAPRFRQVIFTAPRACLRHPRRVRVAVQSYRPYRANVRADWFRNARAYTRWIRLRR